MPKNDNNISMSVIKRLPRYYRFLGNLKKNGIDRISSKELSARMGLTASQIRQDLNCFGGFGQQGYGYNVSQLYKEIGTILGVNNAHPTIIIGMGNLGKAIATHMQFASGGFDIIGLFDCQKVGVKVNGKAILNSANLAEFCEENKPQVAIICVPEESAAGIVSTLVKCGVTNFWNFSHYDIVANYPEAVCENVHLSDSLMTLNYQITHKDD
ncbi:MAG: redox-sensing transcriptional repressor Rex [Clostridia bacterium]|nr:redox-sensing transcriptional repressor Rex [Clostridia bacterium]